MKNIVLLTLLTFAVSACGGAEPSAESSYSETGGGESHSSSTTQTPAGPAAPVCADEGAGASPDSAAALALGSLSGCLGPEPDTFSVRAANHEAGTLYEFQVTASGPVQAKILNSEQQEIFSGAVAAGQTGVFQAVLAKNTTAYFQVLGEGTATYQVETSATPLSDASEPDNSPETAQPLNVGRRHSALLQTAVNDAALGNDYYQVLVGRDGTLTVEVEPGSDEIAIKVQLLSPAGDTIEETIASNRGAAVRVSARVRRGPYFIRVVDSQDTPGRAAFSGPAPRYLTEPYSILVDNN